MKHCLGVSCNRPGTQGDDLPRHGRSCGMFPGGGVLVISNRSHTTTNDLLFHPVASSTETKSRTNLDPMASCALPSGPLRSTNDRHAANLGPRLSTNPCHASACCSRPRLVLTNSLAPATFCHEAGFETIIWQRIDLGSTRNCVNSYILLAFLHVVADWAYTIWRPGFCRVNRLDGSLNYENRRAVICSAGRQPTFSSLDQPWSARQGLPPPGTPNLGPTVSNLSDRIM